MIYEALTQSYTEIVAAIHEEAFGESWSTDAFTDLMNMPASFGIIAHENHDPCGFILCQGDHHESEIIAIATCIPYRRKGIGTGLIDRALMQTKRLFLEVGADNEAAYDFYIRYGFEKVGQRKNYYARSEGRKVDALIMAMTNKNKV